MSSRAQDLVFLAVHFDFGAAVFADEHAVAHLTSKATFLPSSSVLPVPSATTMPSGRFFLGGIGDDDPALLDFLLFDRFDEDPVAEGFEFNCHIWF